MIAEARVSFKRTHIKAIDKQRGGTRFTFPIVYLFPNLIPFTGCVSNSSFLTVGLCLPISSSLLVFAYLGEANHPKEIPRGKSLRSYEAHKEELVCSAYLVVETLPSYREQECYYSVMDSCFTQLPKSVLLNV